MKILIVVDMQNGFMTKRNYIELKEKIENYLKRNNYDKVILTKFKNDISKNPLYQERIGWNKLVSNEEQEFCIDFPKDAIVFEKFGYGLEHKDLDYIKNLDAKSIDICGLKSNACVYAIALQLFDAGINPNILFNYVECEPELKESMKQIFIKQFGSVDERY